MSRGILREGLKMETTNWLMGPYDSRLPGPMSLQLELDGERVLSAKIETGFLHRGVEKTLETQSWPAAIAYADRVDPEAGIFGELALCMAVEEILGWEISPRARDIRLMLCELGRIASHLGYIVHFAHVVNSETMVHYVLRDREKILDLFELITGARFTHNFFRYGGVRADVTEGFVERVQDVCEVLKVRIKEYNDLLTFNYAFLQRSLDIGWLSAERVLALGMTGPNARASGVTQDIRKDFPYLGYERLDFKVPAGRHEPRAIPGGDANDRFVVRLREIAESIEILKQVVETIPKGEFRIPMPEGPFTVPVGEAYVRVEGPRGLLGCHVVSDGSIHPARIQYRAASAASLQGVPELLRGVRLEDLPVVLASLDLSIAEVDR